MTRPADWPTGPYRLILADPPWSYANFSDTLHGAAAAHYPTMGLDEIRALPVAGLADPEWCALVVWGTWPKLAEALAVVEAWGFHYKTCALVWVKTYASGAPYCGMGFYTRSGSEFALLGTRGRAPAAVREARDVLQVLTAPVTEHSAKPPEAAERLERLFPGPRLELFARRRWPGWDAWGNEVRPAMPLFEGEP